MKICLRLKADIASGDMKDTSSSSPADELTGTIEGAFGKTGKFKVRFNDGGLESFIAGRPLHNFQLVLVLRRYLFRKDANSKFTQT
jgi:hypothetical protein